MKTNLEDIRSCIAMVLENDGPNAIKEDSADYLILEYALKKLDDILDDIEK